MNKNDNGTMMVINLEAYPRIVELTEQSLDEADRVAERNVERYIHEDVFSKLRGRING